MDYFIFTLLVGIGAVMVAILYKLTQLEAYLKKGNENTVQEPETVVREHDNGFDPLYNEAKHQVVTAGHASASFLQRRLEIGYARAARLLDQMEEDGIIGPAVGASPREVLQTADEPKHQLN